MKYGETNGEVYAEVASSRLFWALGFAVDRMYPVSVLCRNCPPDPFKEGKEDWHLGKSANGATRRLQIWPSSSATSTVRKSRCLATRAGRGPNWSFVDEESGGAPRAHVDALKLLAVFVQHVDNKPEQQAIVCYRCTRASRSCRQCDLCGADSGRQGSGLDVWRGALFNYDK